MFIRKNQLSERLGVSCSTIDRMRKNEEIPQPYKISQRILLWREDEIEKWLEEVADDEYVSKIFDRMNKSEIDQQ